MIDKIKQNRPTIEIDPAFKEHLKEDLTKRSQTIKTGRKVLPFLKVPTYLSIGAAAILTIFIGLPNFVQDKTTTEVTVETFDSLSLTKGDLAKIADISNTKKAEEKVYETEAFGESLALVPSISSSAETKWGMDLELSLEEVMNTEEYVGITENRFLSTIDNPLSTFSIDVDTASYANVRRFVNSGSLPPKDSVRIEEMINYFDYDYPLPERGKPFSINTEISTSPWNQENRLVHIGIQGSDIPDHKLPPSNIVFLIDVSGSMEDENKLGLLKKSVKLMLKEFSRKDRVAIVTYAGNAGLVLPSTPGDQTEKITDAFNNLSAGGSTAGAQGIELAYQIAQENFIKDGNNRVILATDGDFNIGTSSSGDLKRLIQEKSDSGVYLTVLGLGMGNYKDSRMESLADSGNGNYAYLDSLLEAQKVLVEDIKKTLFVIAKDVKIQVEFNPAVVSTYRLIGYETRALNSEDFADDKVDAGDIGSGHTVTALYEISLVKDENSVTDNLRYRDTNISETAKTKDEILTLGLRYKEPTESESKLIELNVKNKVTVLDKTSDNFRFSAAVAAYGQILRGSEYINNFSYDDVITLTKDAMDDDDFGYRAEFYTLLRKVKLLEE